MESSYTLECELRFPKRGDPGSDIDDIHDILAASLSMTQEYRSAQLKLIEDQGIALPPMAMLAFGGVMNLCSVKSTLPSEVSATHLVMIQNPDLLEMIFRYLDPASVKTVSLVSR